MQKQLIILAAITTLALSGCDLLGYKKLPKKNAAAPVEAPTPQIQAKALIEKIQADIKSWRLTSPKGNNAAEKLSELKKVDPSNQSIATIETQIADKYIGLADRTLAKEKTPSLSTLKKALRYIKTANSVTKGSKALAKKEQQISDLIDINTQQAKLKQAKADAEKRKNAELAKNKAALAEKSAQAQNDLKTSAKTLIDESAPPSSIALAKPVSPALQIPTSTDTLLVFSQDDVDNQSNTLGLELDKLSRKIIAQNSAVIIHAKDESDYRWINGSLNTYIYLLDPNFSLNSTAKIGAQEYPSIELAQ